jgi:hypothetical protein
MAISDDIRALIVQPRETLTVEVKNWLELSNPAHKAKIIKGLIALRNFNGGYLVIGFDDATMQPSKDAPNYDPTVMYSADVIQALISKYVSEPFEVIVEFAERDGIKHPVFIVPAGVKSPVAAKAGLNDGNKTLICAHDVYVRSLNSNNIASSTKVLWRDWPNIVQICFDNREADIGNFLRRHLGVAAREKLLHLLADTMPPSHRENVEAFLRESADRFEEVTKDQNTIPPHGYWEVAMVINGEVPVHRLNLDFMRMLDAHNPRYTGWPVWMSTEQFKNESERPHVYDDRLYEALIVNIGNLWRSHIDFMRLDPTGKFYLRRAFEDDLGLTNRAPAPLTALEFVLPILRVAETIAVGLAFAKAMGCKPEETLLSYLFVWHNLRGRTLSNWANPQRSLYGHQPADRDQAHAYIEVPLDMPLSRLGSITKEVIDPLFDAFDQEISQAVFDDLTTQLVTRNVRN